MTIQERITEAIGICSDIQTDLRQLDGLYSNPSRAEFYLENIEEILLPDLERHIVALVRYCGIARRRKLAARKDQTDFSHGGSL